MKTNYFKIYVTLISVLCMGISCASNNGKSGQRLDIKKDTICVNNGNLKYEGRFLFEGDSVRYDYPGSTISFCFSGNSVDALLKKNAGYYMVEIDNHEPYKLNTYGLATDGHSTFNLAKGLSEGNHKLTLTLISEGLFVKPACYGFLVAQGSLVSKDTLRKNLKLEFIGNSITCGYGVEAKDGQDHFSDSTSNVCKAYAMLTAKALNAEKMVVARSGIGVYRNYADDPNGSEFPMSKVYFSTLITDLEDEWDFQQYMPDILCINLGTNDMSTEGYSIEKFELTYNEFLNKIRQKYPTTKIVMLTGTMLEGQSAIDQKDVLNRVAKQRQEIGDSLIYRFDMTPQDGSMGYGADYHPSIQTQQRMAEELTAFLKTIL